MPDSFTVKIEGLAELRAAMQQLPDRVNRTAVRSSLQAGAAIIRNAAKAKAPVYHGEVAQGHPAPGTLRKSIVTKYAAELSTPAYQVYIVTVRRGKKYQQVTQRVRGGGVRVVNLDAYYWTFVEFGTSKMPGTSFMRTAFSEQQHAAAERIKGKLAERVELEAAKLARV